MLRTYTLSPSLQSHGLHALLKATSKQTPCTEKTKQHCLAYIDRMQQVNAQPFPNPEKLVGCPVTEDNSCGMQTFFWGGQDKPRQKVLLYLHGGAYMNPPTSFHFKMLANLARGTGSMAVFPVYPKIPDHSYADTFPCWPSTTVCAPNTVPGRSPWRGIPPAAGWPWALPTISAIWAALSPASCF